MTSVDIHTHKPFSMMAAATAFVTGITAAARNWGATRRRRRAVASLQGLDARALDDIGLDRPEIRSVVFCPAGRRRGYEGA